MTTVRAPRARASERQGAQFSDLPARTWQLGQVRASIFPSWAPPDVVEMWRVESDAARDGYRDRWIASGDPQLVAEYRERAFGIPELLHRTLRDPRMGAVWPRFSASDVEVSIFAATIVRAWMGPQAEERWTPRERARWEQEVSGLASRLASKVQGTAADELLRRAFGTLEAEPGELSDLLRRLAHGAGSLLAPQILTRPRGPQARRAYAVRVLSAFCRGRFARDEYRLVAITAAVALVDDDLGARQVRRLLRGR